MRPAFGILKSLSGFDQVKTGKEITDLSHNDDNVGQIK